VTVGSDEDLLRGRFRARRLNWISVAAPTAPMRVEAKIRHRHEPAPATVSLIEDDCVEVVFDQPQRAVTPGQSAVFYQGDEVVGGGWIE
jgi:tRNA-specific 2-thiouridylase